MGGGKHTGMVILELGDIIHIPIDNNIHVISLVVRRNVARRKDLGHDGLLGWILRMKKKKGRKGEREESRVKSQNGVQAVQWALNPRRRHSTITCESVEAVEAGVSKSVPK